MGIFSLTGSGFGDTGFDAAAGGLDVVDGFDVEVCAEFCGSAKKNVNLSISSS